MSTRLGQEGTPLGRTAASDVLREEGFAAAARPRGRGQHQPGHLQPGHPAASRRLTDFAALPAHAHTTMAGLLLAIPTWSPSTCPRWPRAGYPGTKTIPAASYLLALLALKLTATRRVSHVDDLLTDPAPALLAGLSILPKKSALTDYSYRLSHDHQQRFLAALDHRDDQRGPGHR